MGIFSRKPDSSVLLEGYANDHAEWIKDGDAYSRRLEDTFATIRSNRRDEILLSVICQTEIRMAQEVLEERKEQNLVFQVMPIDEGSPYSIGLVHRYLKVDDFEKEIDSAISDLEQNSRVINQEFAKYGELGKSGLFHLARMLPSGPIPLIGSNTRGLEIANAFENSPIFPMVGVISIARHLGYDQSVIRDATLAAYENLVNLLRSDNPSFEDSEDFYSFASKALAPSFSGLKHPVYNKFFWEELTVYTKLLNGDFGNLPNWW
jgi:hypothetical protein